MVKTIGDNGDFGKVEHHYNSGVSNPHPGVNDRFIHGERRSVNVGAGHQLIKLVLAVVGASRPLSPTL